MDTQTQVAALHARIVMAESERTGYFVTSDYERFREACALIDRLAKELWDLRLAQLREEEAPASLGSEPESSRFWSAGL